MSGSRGIMRGRLGRVGAVGEEAGLGDYEI